MIKVFSGNWRGLGDPEKNRLGMLLEFRFREYLHYFKGAALSVFLNICLHSDENGHAFPSYDLLERETGYGRETISRALDYLCNLEIEGQRVIMRWRERDSSGKFVGSNHYLIFPTAEELKAEVSEDQPDEQEQPERRTAANVQGDMMDGLLYFAGVAQQRADAGQLDLGHYPEDVRPYLERVYKLWGLLPPERKQAGYARWVKDARSLKAACAEFGPAILDETFAHWEKNNFFVSGPGALVNVSRFAAGQKRKQEASQPQQVKYDQAEIERFQAAIMAQRASQ